MSETTNDIITLIDEDGREHDFEVEAFLDVEDEKYAVLIPRSDEYEGLDEAVIMRFGKNEQGEEILFDIESDEEWERVADAYDNIIEEFDD
ncbi:MAG: DUF1292 domain-containing protein [Bacillota bacterium]|nr:DUF1292 domain-containing protein [Bacillota bacterium]